MSIITEVVSSSGRLFEFRTTSSTPEMKNLKFIFQVHLRYCFYIEVQMNQGLSRNKKILFTAVACLLISFVVFIIGELAVRLLVKRTNLSIEDWRLPMDGSVFSRHVFEPKERILKKDAQRWQINSLGYRGKNFPVKKPSDEYRVLIYGGSFVFDIEAKTDQHWPQLVENNLRKLGLHKVKVINAGIPGHASFDCLGRLMAEGHLFEPDLVVLCTAWNDIKYFNEQKPLLRAFKPFARTDNPLATYQNWLDELLCRYSQLYVRLRQRYYAWVINVDTEGAVPKGDTLDKISEKGLAQYKLTLQTFVDLVRNIGAEPILMTQCRLVSPTNDEKEKKRIKYQYVKLTHKALCRAFEKTDGIVKKIASEKGCLLIDTSAPMTGQSQLFSDHIHTNPKGSQIIGTLVAEALKKKVEEKN